MRAVVFLGDSITEGWADAGRSVWKKCSAPLNAANFGIGGDRTEHVIWSLRHDELEGAGRSWKASSPSWWY